MFDNDTAIDTSDWPVEGLVPHSGHMVLLDKVLICSALAIRAELTIMDNALFMNNGEVPAWVAIEYMAQAIGAYAGVQAKLANKPVVVGLLIGARKLESDIPSFLVGDKLTIEANQIHAEDSGLSVFACKVETSRGNITANLNVFVPNDIDAYMSGGSE